MAFDIVGTLPRTVRGYKYLLMYMCLASKYPEAIPLKKVDAETVADAMFEMFSITGTSAELLTDQGSVFMRKLTLQLFDKWNIKKLNTSAYHPQTDGCLERWHATLKKMLLKCGEKKDWDVTLKYLLFAYRSTTHANTGLSPFEVVFGRQVIGPLEVLAESWCDDEEKEMNVVEWVSELKRKLELVREVVREKETKAKKAMKATYDRNAKERDLEVGSLVLVKVPRLTGKLDDKWEGPFEVARKLGDVNYEVIVPGKRQRKRTVHTNNCKQWKEVEAAVLRVVVADEVEQEKLDKTKLLGKKLSEEQQKQLTDLLGQYGDVLSEIPGKYRVAPAWKDQLRAEVKLLMEAGIVEKSKSPWSSLMVPVRKPDGLVRLCVDYRKVNAVTEPDPYHMPRVDEMIEQIGEEQYLTKIDLTKGYYQIPVLPEDRPKTAFCTPWGKFQFTRMPFGLRNAPTTFQRVMDGVLDGLEQYSGAYIDDILIFSETWTNHLWHIKHVLDRLRQNGLTARPKKCEWGANKLEYLGFVVGKGLMEVPEASYERL